MPTTQPNVLQRFTAKLAILAAFWPAVLFVAIVLLLFVYVSQGRDVVRITLEDPQRILLTMAGTHVSQTDINNLRLGRTMQASHGSYHTIDVYSVRTLPSATTSA